MMLRTSFTIILLTYLVLLLSIPRFYSFKINVTQASSPKLEADLVEFTLNFVYMAADFFLIGATGCGLDVVAPGLAQGGPPPIGGQMANLDTLTKDVILQHGLIAVGHLRAIKHEVKGFPRPLIDISKELFAHIVDQAFGRPLHPRFDPYANSLNYRLAMYIISAAGPEVYAGIIPKLQNTAFKELVAGLLGPAFGIKISNRDYLYERRDLEVPPYKVTVAKFTDCISKKVNILARTGTKSEALVVPAWKGAEGIVSGNLIDADEKSLSYITTPKEILRIAYCSGNECVPGGYFPKGANGLIAKNYLFSC